MSIERYIDVGKDCKFCRNRATWALIHQDGKFGYSVCCNEHYDECKDHVIDSKGGLQYQLPLRFAGGPVGSSHRFNEGMQSNLTHHFHGRTYGSADSDSARHAQGQYDMGNIVDRVLTGESPADVLDDLDTDDETTSE